MKKANQLRKQHIKWITALLWNILKVQYDPIGHEIMEKVIFSDNPNIAEIGRENKLSREAVHARLRKIERDLGDLWEVIN